MKTLPRRKRGLDPMIAMINVVFILLAFFMLGSLREPLPPGLVLPRAGAFEDSDARRVFIDEMGEIVSSARPKAGEAVILSADARLDANALITLAGAIRSEGVYVLGLEVSE